MGLFAISDLHFGTAVEKSMNIFGETWYNHMEKIQHNWQQRVKSEDAVLIPGDISWGINRAEAKSDLDYINALPGTKILVRGNHDFWWQKIGQLNQMYPNIHFLQNNAYELEEWIVCGTRGWICPNESCFSEKDAMLYKREVIRLELSLKAASNMGKKKIIAMMHYAPTNDRLETSAFTRLFEQYDVSHVFYGHLHGKFVNGTYLEGLHRGVNYHLVSADYLDFIPLLVETEY
ncbi:MAG: metallophosphoesterase [Cellulosilyticaceae bacterium]